MNLRPVFFAATRVEPLPANGSRMRSPGFVTDVMRFAMSPTGFSVGCIIWALPSLLKVTRSFGLCPGKLYFPLIAKTMFSWDGANAAFVSPIP